MLEITPIPKRGDFEKDVPYRRSIFDYDMPAGIIMVERPELSDLRFGSVIQLWVNPHNNCDQLLNVVVVGFDPENLLALVHDSSSPRVFWVRVKDIKLAIYDPVAIELTSHLHNTNYQPDIIKQ